MLAVAAGLLSEGPDHIRLMLAAVSTSQTAPGLPAGVVAVTVSPPVTCSYSARFTALDISYELIQRSRIFKEPLAEVWVLRPRWSNEQLTWQLTGLAQTASRRRSEPRHWVKVLQRMYHHRKS